MCLAACSLTSVPASDNTAVCVTDGRTLSVAFYAYFAPVSHSADEDPASDGFNTHLGYESDLLTALEAMESAGLSFSLSPIQA